MRVTKSAILAFTLGLSLTAACRGSSDSNGGTPDAPSGGGGIDGGNGSGSGSGSGSGGFVHIQDVQSDTMAAKTPVSLHGVVVVAIDTFGNKTGQDMWIEEVGGGKRSGVHVFRPDITQITNLVPGDIINLTGAIKTEFPTPNPVVTPSVTSVTELQAPTGGKMTITKIGHGAVPAPALLDAAALDAMSESDRAVFLEDWEGVLVSLQSVRPAGPPTSFSTTPADDTMTFGITSGLAVDSNLSAFPANIDNSVCLKSVTGVIDFVASKYVIYPDSTDEIVTGGTDCPAQTIPMPTTVADIQNGKTKGFVKLTGVFITGVETTPAGVQTGPRVWVADALQAAPRSGVLIFQPNVVNATTSPLGTKVDVVGAVGEFLATGGTGKTETEFGADKKVPTTVTLNTAATAAPTPIAVNVTDVADIDAGEAYEGVLVQLSNVKVTKAADSFNQVELSDSAGHTVIMSVDAFDNYGGSQAATPPALGTCFPTLIGLMDVQTKINVRTINPRSNADMTPGSGCN